MGVLKVTTLIMCVYWKMRARVVIVKILHIEFWNWIFSFNFYVKRYSWHC